MIDCVNCHGCPSRFVVYLYAFLLADAGGLLLATGGVADIEQSVVRLNSQDMLGEEESMDAWERVGEPLEYYGFD